MARIAEAHDATTGQVALAWLLQRSEVMLPIPGTGSVEHLEENVAAAELELTDDEVAELDKRRRRGLAATRQENPPIGGALTPDHSGTTMSRACARPGAHS